MKIAEGFIRLLLPPVLIPEPLSHLQDGFYSTSNLLLARPALHEIWWCCEMRCSNFLCEANFQIPA